MRTDLVSLIGESVSLQAQHGGREYVGLCPFHDDHRPSMRVYPERQTFRCWSCNTGGDCFEFVMQRERVGFREALEMLAARARLEMPRSRSHSSPEDPVGKPRLLEILGWAEQQFHQALLELPAAAAARDYLAGRGFTGETIQRFRLGYHPNDWEWLLNRARGKYTPQQLLAARLVGERQNGSGCYDYFVDRVLFPIRDEQRRPVAFGGRVLPGREGADRAKYWNSPESLLFSKSRLLYGLDVARDGIRTADTAVVVEGYTDCIMAHQCGIPHVVGTLGTALTESHVTVLRRFARKVVLVYDGDEAGRNAAERSLARFLNQEVDLRILTLPGGADPADVLLTEGREWFEEQLSQAVEVWEYKFRSVSERYGFDSIDACHRVLEEMLEVLCQVPTFMGATLAGPWQVREDILLGKLSQRLGIPETTVRQRLSELRTQRQQRQETRAVIRTEPETRPSSAQLERLIRKPTRDEQLECELLEILFSNPETVSSVRAEIRLEEVNHPALRRLLQLCYELDDRGRPSSCEMVLAELEDSRLKQLATFLDEQGRRKKIEPDLLVHTLKCFQQRRDLASHSLPAGSAGSTLEDWEQPPTESKTLLQRAMEFNRKRVNRQ